MDEINLETKTRSTCSEEETADLLSLAGTFILYLLLTRFRSIVGKGAVILSEPERHCLE